MKKLNVFLVSVLAAAALNAAVIEQVIVRQQWPWSTDIKVEYRLSAVTNPVDIAIQAFNGATELALPAEAITGDRFGIAEDGVGTLVIDPVAAFGTEKVALANFKVKLTLSESSTNIGEVLYRIYDLTDGSYVDVTRAELLNGKYGSVVTDYAAFFPGCHPDVPDILIWTGVTNNPAYMTTKLVMRKIAADGKTYTMGSPTTEIGRQNNMDKTKDGTNPTGRETQHSVTLTNDFYIGVFELTQRQHELIDGTNPSAYTGADRDCHPVEKIQYKLFRGANSTIGNWPKDLGHAVVSGTVLDKLRKKFAGEPKFDFPTEAQWEFACRGGMATAWYDGANPTGEHDTYAPKELSAIARYKRNNGGGTTARVGSYLPNAYGLYDMLGNVSEWCLDWYASFTDAAVTDPVGPFQDAAWLSQYGYPGRTARGGGYDMVAYLMRAAQREHRSYDDSGLSASGGARLCLIIEK